MIQLTIQYAPGDGNDNGSITLKDAFGKTLNIETVSGGTSTNTETNTETTTTLPSGLKYNTNKTQITVGTKFKGDTVDLTEYASTVKTVKATSFNKKLTINGNDLDNVIKAGKKSTAVYGEEGNDNITGGNGADTLSGGEGNDTLKGGSGKDLFIYDGSGADIITDYKAGQDKIYIDGDVDSVTVNGKNIIFNVGEGTLTIKNGKSKKITLVDSEGNTISNNKYTKSTKVSNFIESFNNDMWFAKDDNFTTTDMDSIIKVDDTDYSVGKLDFAINNKQLITNDETTITYTEYKK